MNIFDLFSIFTGASDIMAEERWYNTTATFTGNRVNMSENTPAGLPVIHGYAYEIKYYDYDGDEVIAWHMFPNGENPDPEMLAGKTIEIKYEESDPTTFVAA